MHKIGWGGGRNMQLRRGADGNKEKLSEVILNVCLSFRIVCITDEAKGEFTNAVSVRVQEEESSKQRFSFLVSHNFTKIIKTWQGNRQGNRIIESQSMDQALWVGNGVI